MVTTMKSDTPISFSDIVHISEGAKPSINLFLDLDDHSKVKNYIPTKTAQEMLSQLAIALSDGNNAGRARYLFGPYGGGKSHLALVLQHLMRFGPSSEAMQEIWKKLVGLGSKGAQIVEEFRNSWLKQTGEKGFLVVILQADDGPFRQAMLNALNRALKKELDSETINKLQPSTIYDAAIKQLELWEQEHPDLYNKARQFENLEELVIDLESFQHDAFAKFNELFKKVTGGGAFDPGQWAKTREVYAEVAKRLLEYGYRGIFVIHDEFGEYLSRAIRDDVDGNQQSGLYSRSEGIELQDFAEMCVSSGDAQIHYLMCAHLDVVRYAELSRGDDEVKKTWEKYFGRSQQTRITALGGDKEVIQLIDGVIVQYHDKWNDFIRNGAQSRLVNITRDARTLDFFPAQNWEPATVEREVVHGCYPLHPAALYALPRLSVLLGQNERTMFTFISGNDTGALGEYMRYHPPFLPLIAPMFSIDKLFEYFLPSIDTNRPKQKDWYKGAIYTAGGAGAPELEIRLIKLLVLWQIMREGEVIPLTQIRAVFALDLDPLLGFEQLTDTINHLKSKEVLYLNKDGVINPYGIDRASIEDAIVDRIKKIRPNHHPGLFLKNKNGQLLSSILRIDDIAPIAYQREIGLTRFFSAEYVVVNELLLVGKKANKFSSPFLQLLVPLNDSSDGTDGLVLFFLPQTPSEVQAIKTAATTTLKHPRVIVVIPPNAVEIEVLTLRLDAIMSLLDESQSKEEIRLRLEDKQEQVIEELEQILGPVLQFTQGARGAEIYINGERLAKGFAGLEDLESEVDRILRNTYSFEVPIKDENFGQRKVTPASSKIRKQLVSSILRFETFDSHQRENFGYGDTSAERRILRSVLIAHDILKQQGSVWEISKPIKPQEKNLGIIWDKIHNYFFCYDGVIESADTSINTLLEPPYGVYRNLLPIYIACVIYKQIKQITFYEKFKELPRSTDYINVIEQMVEKPEDYEFKWQGVQAEQRTFMTAILKELRVTLDSSDVVFERVSEELVKFYRSLPNFTRQSQELSGEPVQLRNLLSKAERGQINAEGLVESLELVLDAKAEVANCKGKLEELTTLRVKFSSLLRQLKEFLPEKEKEISSYLYPKLAEFLKLANNVEYSVIHAGLASYFDERDSESLRNAAGQPGLAELLHAVKEQGTYEQLVSDLISRWFQKSMGDWEDKDYSRFISNADNLVHLLQILPQKRDEQVVPPPTPTPLEAVPYLEEPFMLAMLEVLNPELKSHEVNLENLVASLAYHYAQLPNYTKFTRNLPPKCYQLRKSLKQAADEVDSKTLLAELSNVVGLGNCKEYSPTMLDTAVESLENNLEQLKAFADNVAKGYRMEALQIIANLVGNPPHTNPDELVEHLSAYLETRDKSKLEQFEREGLLGARTILSTRVKKFSFSELLDALQREISGQSFQNWDDNCVHRYANSMEHLFRKLNFIPEGPKVGAIRVTIGINEKIDHYDAPPPGLDSEALSSFNKDFVQVLKKYSLYNTRGITATAHFLKSLVSTAVKTEKDKQSNH